MRTTTEARQLATVLARHRRLIRRLLLWLGVSSCDVEDLQQEAEHAIARGLPHFDPARSPKPETALESWIFAICKRLASGYHRSRSRRPDVLMPGYPLHEARSSWVSSEAPR